MTVYDYKVIPAPTKGTKAPGVKTAEGRFANAIEALLNAQARDGWEYLRSDMLPSDERHGLTSTQTVYRTLLVFRRAIVSNETVADEVIATATTLAESVAPAPSETDADADAISAGVQEDQPDLSDPAETPPDRSDRG